MVVTVVSDGFFTNVIGKVPLRIVYFLCICPITRSTWILTLANWRDFSTSSRDSCCFPRVKAGISSFPPFIAMSSCTLNPRSASFTSPGSIKFRNPHCWVITLSDTLPLQAEEI